MSDFEPKAGMFCRTRNGRKAYIAANVKNPFRETTFPLTGFIQGESGDCADFWTAKGRYSTSVCDHEFDLVGEWRDPIKVSGWVNIYPSGFISPPNIWPTREKADFQADSRRIACIYVSGEEGEEP